VDLLTLLSLVFVIAASPLYVDLKVAEKLRI
jgi:hypothetical protein